MPKIYIDDQPYDVPEGKNLLEACLGLGLDLPYFCWHPAMGSIGACRQCAVVQYQNEEDTRGRIVMGCMTKVTDEARFSLGGEKASEFRKDIIESLMTNHPHDCPVCAEGGECHLQDMTVMSGHRDRRYRGKKRTFRNQYLGPLIHHEMNRCITCYRCVRFYRDYAGGTDLTEQASQNHVYFGRHSEGVLENEFSGNLVEVCPTGVFTDKPLAHDYTRKWDLQSAPSVCTACAVGCNTAPGERYGKLKRIQNRYNHEVNGYFICDRGRYGGAYVNSDKRLSYAGLREDDGRFRAIEKEEALQQVAAWIAEGKSVAAIGSPRASLESNYLLHALVGAGNYCPGFQVDEHQMVLDVADQLKNSGVLTPSLRQMESADAVLILGEDVTNTAPRVALALRQAVRNKAFDLAENLGLDLWQDAAVRNLAQDKRSPLFIAAVAGTRLDDIAEASVSLAPDDIARFGGAIADRLENKAKALELDDQTNEVIDRIVAALKNAKRPLVVSGTGCRNKALIDIAARIAIALHNDDRQPMLSYCLPEANSLGLALMGEMPTVSDIVQRARAGEIKTLIVVENDLYRRAPSSDIDQLLGNVRHLVVIDSIDNATLSHSSLAIPATTFAESEGTLVSSEGRAQRYYPVFMPAEDRKASWRWLADLHRQLQTAGSDQMEHFDQVTQSCAAEFEALADITLAAPAAGFREAGFKIPRQPHRYSGRTAMVANLSVHEPKQPVDDETPLAYSMEGLTGSLSRNLPGAAIPYVWAAGWNSNQSISKFQAEIGGSVRGGSGGVRLLEPGQRGSTLGYIDLPTAVAPRNDDRVLVPCYQIFGSDELSLHSPAIAELAGVASARLHPEDAQKLGVENGDGVTIEGVDLEVFIDASLAAGCVGYSVGMPGTFDLASGSLVSMQKAASWQRRTPRMIASDGARSHE